MENLPIPDRKIVEGNLVKMTTKGEGNMPELVNGESIGGNAGNYQGFPCLAANFYFDKNTGEIKYFGNIQDIPEDIIVNYTKGVLRIALCLPLQDPNSKDIRLKIVEKIYPLPLNEFNPQARSNLRESIHQYNQRQ